MQRPSTKAKDRIPNGRDPSAHAALPHVAAEPSLHWRHARQKTGRAGRPKEGGCHCGAQHLGAATVVEAGRMARSENELIATGGSCPPTSHIKPGSINARQPK